MPICRFAAEPPQGNLPPEPTLQAEFMAACLRVEVEEGDPELGAATEIHWFPDRSWSGRTYVPATTRTDTGLEIFGYVSFSPGDEPSDLYAWADYTSDTADDHPEWKMDISQEVVGGWRGDQGHVAAMTLIWGVAMVPGALVTAELGRTTVDEAALEGERFTLLAPDAYEDTFLEIVLRDRAGNTQARESLYEEEEDE
jgi:hypothetical protein